ncbi:coat protein [Verticillium albo-atrum partitivirus-1]|nr:coat protein [Verticillium albo-atrum partitivirus-1]
MSDTHSLPSVNPSESVSNVTPRKKNRPGKNARAARSALTPPSSAVTAPSSQASALQFASAAVAPPIPQPGKFPVVFDTGAGEPTQDEVFSYDHRKIKDIIKPYPERYIYSARYAEFSTNSGYVDDDFSRDVIRFFLLGIAQQTVFTHVNMGLPLGDFSSVASTDVFHFGSLRAITSQFGEFSVPSLGTRFLLSDYVSTVSSLVHTAKQIDGSNTDMDTLDRSWLPMSNKDKRTKHIVATCLQQYALQFGVKLEVAPLAADLFEQENAAFNAAKVLFGNDATLFDFMFQNMDNTADWATHFSPAASQRAIRTLGLAWRKPQAAHLDFAFLTKVQFPILLDGWARKKATITKFFSCGASVTSRSTALGAASQLSSVSSVSGVTILQTQLALSAPEFSLLACFPVSAFYRPPSEYLVRKSTSIPVVVRSTEFAQLDWL